jgi:uncharacterized phage protein gp47/JayE
MPVYGLTPEGFVGKPATQSKADFDASFKGVYGASVGSEADGSIPAATSIGQEVEILTDAQSSDWEMLGAVVTAFDVDQAVTPQLQQLCALTGTVQEGAQNSSVIETCSGIAGTVLPVGRVVTVQTTGTRFLSQAPATLALITATWSALTAYDLNDLIIHDSSVWQVIVAGTSSAGSPPTGTGTQVDGTVTWQRVGASTLGVALVDYAAEQTGALSAAAGQLTAIATPVPGWTGAYNFLAATLGRAIETEPALRARRKLELQGQGGGPADAIRAKILRTLPSVTACIVFVNKGDVVDADGVPAHGVEVLIQAPTTSPTTDAELALAVWRAVGAGIDTGGTTTEVITDASGNSQTVKFSRPVEVPIYSALTVFYLASAWPGGAAAVRAATKSALGTLFAGYQIGDDVRSAVLGAAVLDGPQEVNAAGDAVIPATAGSQAAPGLLGVANGAGTDGTLPYIGTAPAPVTSTKVTITLRQLPTLDPANVTVTATAATP